MSPSIVLVGPGRLGRTVARALQQAGWSVTLVSRGQPIPPAPLIWLTVPDAAIAAVSQQIPPGETGQVVLHASGALDLGPLAPHPHVGSLHPLMTFPGPEHATPQDVPAAIAGDPVARAAAGALAQALGWRPFTVEGDRALYHAAAVIAGNYITTLLATAAEVLVAAGVSPQEAPALLAPLARASLDNAVRLGPREALTGPLARGDEATIDRHRRALQAHDLPRAEALYGALLEATRALLRPPD